MTNLKLITICLLFVLSTVDLSNSWKYDRTPRLYGDKLQFRFISTRNKKVQRRIVMLHDFFRTKVSPQASNILSMKWHHGAAKSAQKWANKCYVLTHDTPRGRWINNYGACGQNIFVSTHKVPWLFALRTWFLERNNFTYGSNQNDLNIIGHYTQMIWASTHKVGCGLAKCARGGPRDKPFFNYVCNYCPIGNRIEQLGRPYELGSPCSKCPNSCHKNRKLCHNSCNAADLWANCNDLHESYPNWLCKSNSSEGYERHRNCLATCNCQNKIHD